MIGIAHTSVAEEPVSHLEINSYSFGPIVFGESDEVSLPEAERVVQQQQQSPPVADQPPHLAQVAEVGIVQSPLSGNKRKEREDGASIVWECPVCLDAFGAPGFIPCTLSGCSHMLCLTCARKELVASRGCPKCRKRFTRITPLLDLVNRNDAVAETNLRDFDASLSGVSLHSRIDALPICEDPVLKRRVAFVADYIKSKGESNPGKAKYTVAWSYVPAFDIGRITLLVKEARKVFGLRKPTRQKLKATLHQRALVLEDSLNELFKPKMRISAIEQVNSNDTAQVYMRFRVVRL